jgi:hypothetical protein
MTTYRLGERTIWWECQCGAANEWHDQAEVADRDIVCARCGRRHDDNGDNGIYTVTSVGNLSLPWTLERDWELN